MFNKALVYTFENSFYGYVDEKKIKGDKNNMNNANK